MRLVKAATVEPKTSSSSLQEAALRREIREARRTYSGEHPNVALAHIQLGDYFAHEERFEEAESSYRVASEIYETLGMGHELLHAMALRSLSVVVCAQDRHKEGKAISKRAIDMIVNYQ